MAHRTARSYCCFKNSSCADESWPGLCVGPRKLVKHASRADFYIEVRKKTKRTSEGTNEVAGSSRKASSNVDVQGESSLLVSEIEKEREKRAGEAEGEFRVMEKFFNESDENLLGDGCIGTKILSILDENIGYLE